MCCSLLLEGAAFRSDIHAEREAATQQQTRVREFRTAKTFIKERYMPMTNEQVIAYFAALPPKENAKIFMINGMNGTGQSFFIDEPGTNLEEIEDQEQLEPDDHKLITMTYE